MTTMTMTTTREKHTYAHGEPSKAVGGGMPGAVVELTVDHSLRRSTVRVLHNEGGADLGTINRRDGRGDQPIRAKDEYEIEYVAGVSAEEMLLRATTRYGWREVLPGQGWWDGHVFVEPVA